jgi:hypothetical protein
MITPGFALDWAKKLDCEPSSIVQLTGGINANVFRCGNESNFFVLKSYGQLMQSRRDQMRAEVQFLKYAAEVVPRYVPKVLHEDPKHRSVVLEYLMGDTYQDSQAVGPKDIEAATDFFRCLNMDRDFAKQKIDIDAAEGFLSITQHIENLNNRISFFTTAHLPRKYKCQAVSVLTALKGEVDYTTDKVKNLITSRQIKDTLDSDARYLSPGDFGFHNAIRGKYGVKFFDFEFAGWDDPSKTLADFLLQPRIPISGDLRCVFLGNFCKIAGIVVNHRDAALASVLRLKWLCIILAPLNQERLQAILDANQGSPNSFIEARILLAIEYLKRPNLEFFESFNLVLG